MRREPESATAQAAREAYAARQVATENRKSAMLDPEDARWTVAVATAMALQGGRAALITSEKRAEIAKLATRSGLRPFDASLVMGIVQDAARNGEPALSVGVQSRLKLVTAGLRASGNEVSSQDKRAMLSRQRMVLIAVWGVLLGACLMWWLAKWVTQ